jgi:hypothetical protein
MYTCASEAAVFNRGALAVYQGFVDPVLISRDVIATQCEHLFRP